MPTYNFADIMVHLSSLSPFATELFKDYRVDTDAYDEDLSLCDADLALEATLTPAASHGLLEVTAVLRKLAAVLLVRYDGCMLHAATVVYNGKAYAFVAPSGTGKTTHCRLWLDVLGDHAHILNGDKLLLRRSEDQFLAYGNPWNGKEGFGEQGCYPLGGVFFLHRAAENRVCRIHDTDALPLLLAAIAAPKQADARLRLLELMDRFTQSIPLFSLHVNRHPDAVYTALSALEESK